MWKKVLMILNIIVIGLGCLSTYLYISDNDFIDQIVSYSNKEHSTIVNNEYSINIKNDYFKKSNDFSPQNRQDLLNIYYTVISSSNKSFTFYCPRAYISCLNDIKNVTSDNSLLSNINNFVNPFNAYKSVKTSYTSLGKVTITVTKLYSDEDIRLINSKVDELYPSLVLSNKSITENIKNIHDYIINHVKYDTTFISGNSIYRSNTAYGALFQGYAVCSGYTDLMNIFLNKMGITSHKVSNDKHVWNLVYLDNQWLHLDLTFDDPVSTDGKNYLIHDYFLISTDNLKDLDSKRSSNDHVFNEEIYLK